MLSKARTGAEAMGATNVEFREGFAENLPCLRNMPISSSAMAYLT
jgi:hypothetical protein